MEVSYEAPTWSQVYRMLLKLATRIGKSGFTPDVIVGVSRGGWLPARVLSDLLENPNLATVKAESYVGIGEAAEAKLTQELVVDVAGKQVLVVDEVADSGKSLAVTVNHIQDRNAAAIKTATLYRKPKSVVNPDFCEKETCNWVVFPWELKETVRKICQNKTPSKQEKELEKLVAAGVSKQLVDRFKKEISEASSC